MIVQSDGLIDFQLSKNKINSNYFGFLYIDDEGGILNLQATDNDFLSNMAYGMIMDSTDEMHADITGNTVDGSTYGIVMYIDLLSSARVMNNLIRSNQIGLFIKARSFENIFINHNHIVNNATYGIEADVIPGPSKNNILPLDASCNWWGVTNPFYVQGNASGDVNVFPFLLTDVTVPLNEGYDCGGQPPPVPLSYMGLLIAMMCIAGYAAFRFPGRG